MSAKYVVVDSPLNGELMFIFPEHVLHSDFIKEKYDKSKVLSAGFAGFNKGRLFCFGHSISLKVKSRDNVDSVLANRMLGLWDKQ